MKYLTFPSKSEIDYAAIEYCTKSIDLYPNLNQAFIAGVNWALDNIDKEQSYAESFIDDVYECF